MSPQNSPAASWRWACLAGALLLSACGASRIDPSDPVAVCTQAAEQDPAVKAVRSKQLAGYYQNYLFEREYKQVLNQNIDQCMAAKGLARPGGVEKIRND